MKPKINARLEHVRRKPERDQRKKDRRKREKCIHCGKCEPVSDGTVFYCQKDLLALGKIDGPAYNQGRVEGHADIVAKLRQLLDPTDAQHWNLDGLLAEVKRLKQNFDAVELCRAIQFEPDIQIDLDIEQYIKSLVKDNVKLIRQKAALEERLMMYDQRRMKEPTVKMWLNPDEHLQKDNDEIRAANRDLWNALLECLCALAHAYKGPGGQEFAAENCCAVCDGSVREMLRRTPEAFKAAVRALGPTAIDIMQARGISDAETAYQLITKEKP